MKLKPLYDRIIVKRSEGANETSGGLIVPESARIKREQGEVLATGDGKMLQDGSVAKMSVKPGDVVLFVEKLALEIEDGGEKLLVMPEEAVLAIVDRPVS